MLLRVKFDQAKFPSGFEFSSYIFLQTIIKVSKITLSATSPQLHSTPLIYKLPFQLPPSSPLPQQYFHSHQFPSSTKNPQKISPLLLPPSSQDLFPVSPPFSLAVQFLPCKSGYLLHLRLEKTKDVSSHHIQLHRYTYICLIHTYFLSILCFSLYFTTNTNPRAQPPHLPHVALFPNSKS